MRNNALAGLARKAKLEKAARSLFDHTSSFYAATSRAAQPAFRAKIVVFPRN
jgi:hypothetical protein